ncbi:MAG TPA: methyltransferase domain-containing protein [Phycisphaerae bacterium]|nr:methyltransferase domain-containing protein [Phycisphaerae bacterium]
MRADGEAASLPILDVRAEARFLAGHAPGAVNIPLEELARRAHELPPKGAAVRLYDDNPERGKAAAEALRLRGYAVQPAALAADDLRECGPSRAALWRPGPFLVEALECIATATGSLGGRALDIACGTGRDAAYLAMRGYEVDAVDRLPDALERARDLARRSGVRLNTIQADLRHEPVLPAERYDLVTVLRFLHRPLLPAIRECVAPGGFVVYETFHRQDPGRKGQPLDPNHTVADGELAAAFDEFEAILARDGIARGGRIFSQLLARRSG